MCMRKFSLLLLLMLSAVELIAQVQVRGYYRKDGTYVQPHVRSSPDGNPYNNWSYPGNTNPYTGKTASGDPDTYLKNYYNRSSDSRSNTSTNYRSYSSPTLPSYSGSSTSRYNSNSIPSTTADTDFDKLLREYASEVERNRIKSQRTLNTNSYNPSIDYSGQTYNDLIATQNAVGFHDRYNYQEKTTLEEALNELGYDVGLVDGIFDENTIRGIQEFQRRNKLKSDGRLGIASISKLGFRLK